MCLEVERESPRHDKSVMSRMWRKVYWASKFPPWTGWMTPVNLPAFEDCDGLHRFQSWDMGWWPNLASEKLEALRVIDKLVYMWYPRDSSRLREWDKVVVPRTAPAGT